MRFNPHINMTPYDIRYKNILETVHNERVYEMTQQETKRNFEYT